MMPKTDLLVIINPLSGTMPLAQKESLRLFIATEAQRQGFQPELIMTTHAGHATELAAQAAQTGIRRVLVVGGDGTINEAARALRKTATALGIIPMGSGNGLARHMGLPMNPQKATQRALSGKPVLIDSGEINDLPFFCTAGLGFEAYVAHEFANQPTRGLQTYVKTAYRAFWSYKPASYLVDGQETGPLFSLTIANAAQFGNNAWIAPLANIADGQLDLCQIRPFPARMAGLIGWRLFNKSLNTSAYWQSQRLQQTTIESDAPLLAHADGEPILLAGNTCTVRVLPGSLSVLL
ncbi:diacylglycerol kinase [Fibrella sp. HMF5335]|uniref:Diacylglycerol kinase n=2 Tax=Fibrella rubiginis TaxID=2817060 RepID=A0A939K5T3_9BACT|nr:diacylglycerol kinase [Fibrella rubiginis]